MCFVFLKNYNKKPFFLFQAFTELRTKQQLGYIVWGFVRHSANVGGVYIEVQSSVVSPGSIVVFSSNKN